MVVYLLVFGDVLETAGVAGVEAADGVSHPAVAWKAGCALAVLLLCVTSIISKE